MATYIYDFADFITSGGVISQTRMMSTIGQTPSLASLIYGISVSSETETCEFYSSEDLSQSEEATLDGLVASHTGAPWFTYTPILGTFSHAEEQALSADWSDITGGVADLSNFGYPVTNLVAMTKCEVQTDGSGAELEMYENGGNSLMSAPYACPNTSGAWQKIAFFTNQPISSGDKSYVCRGRKNGVNTAKIRFMTLAVSVRVLHP